MPTRPQILILALTALAAGSWTGCSPANRSEVIQETRKSREMLRLGVSDDQRFGWNRSTSPSASQAPAKTGLQWTLPKGWQEKPPSQFRLGSFIVPGDVDCSLSQIGGDVISNITRWRGQYGKPPMSQAEIEALPRHKLLGRDAYLIEIRSDDGRMLAGLVLPGQGRNTFIKMIGKAPAVEAELPNMKLLALSIHTGQAASAGQTASTGPTSGAAALTKAGADHGDGFKWKVPSGWIKSAPRSMRVVNYNPGGNQQLNAYMSLLGGDGGGMHANVNRWRGQLGLSPVDANTIGGLPTLAVLGKACPVVDITSQDGSQAMVVITLPMPQSTLFIKLVGSSSDVNASRSIFEAWCKSLEVDR